MPSPLPKDLTSCFLTNEYYSSRVYVNAVTYKARSIVCRLSSKRTDCAHKIDMEEIEIATGQRNRDRKAFLA